VFLLFDGATRVDVSKYLGQVNRSRDITNEGEVKVPIHVIHFFEEEHSGAMQKLARENSGTYRFVPRPKRDRS
jgi:hypothetical protein